MIDQWWSWVVTLVGVTCFFLAGGKVWWAWYVGLAGQGLWFTYAVVTDQWGFIVGAFLYTFVYTRNAIKWTKEHPRAPKPAVFKETPIPVLKNFGMNDRVWVDGELFEMTYYRHGHPGGPIPKISLSKVPEEELVKIVRKGKK